LKNRICLIIYILNLLFFIGGCGPQKKTCPALATGLEGRQILADYSARVKPIKATGNCTLNYVNEKGKKISQAFPIRIWFISNEKFCIYGDILFNPRGICFAVSDGSYWAYVRPMGFFVSGNVDRAGGDFFTNPSLLVDFLNPPMQDCEKMAFTRNGIVCKDKEKHTQKKIYLDTCTQTADRIIYSGQNSKSTLAIKAEKYEKVKDADFLFPNKLSYEYLDKKNGKNFLELKLDSVKLWQPEQPQIKALFTMPEPGEIEKEKKK
jgi:hypothetical protein